MRTTGIVSLRATVRGKVQGVYFRASMGEVARTNSVTGWVRNNPDGSVEALLQGRAEAVGRVLDWANHGPLGARVESVEVEQADSDPSLRDFRILR